MNFTKFFCVFFVLFFSLSVFAAVPTVTSPTNPEGEWSTEKIIKMRVSYSGATDFSYVVDQIEDTVPDLNGANAELIPATSEDIILGSKLDGVWYFHVRAKNSSGWSETTHYQFKLDSNGPERPAFITATELENGDISVEWGEARDDLSGIAYYNVYRSNLRFVKDGGISREFSVRDAVAKLVGEKISGLNFLDVNVSEGYRYHYKIQPIDNAGNLGRASGIASVRAPSFCDSDPVLAFAVVDGNLSIKLDSTVQFRQGQIVVTDPNGVETIVAENESNVYSIDAGYSLAGKPDGDYNVFFSGIDDDFDICSANDFFVYDTVDPSIEIISPQTTQVLEGSVRFELKALDSGSNASGILSVELFLVKNSGETFVGRAVQEGANFVFDWNTLNYDNGRFTVIARVKDNGGNSSEVSGLYSFQNTFFARVAAQDALAAAQAKHTQATLFVADLASKGIDVSDLNAALVNADSNLLYAEELFDQGYYYDISKAQAEKSTTIYSALLSRISVSDYGSGVYTYNLEQLDAFLGASGLDSAIVSESKGLIEITQPSRRLKITKVTKDNETFYLATVNISFTNSAGDSLDVRVLEIIPKKFIDDASNISSGSVFEVIQNDPIIAFESLVVEPGKSASISYSIKQNLTKWQADALVQSNVMAFYVSPPMIVYSTTDLSAVRLSSLLNFNSFVSSLPPIEFNTTNLIILGVAGLIIFFVIILIILLSVFGIYYFFIRKKRR